MAKLNALLIKCCTWAGLVGVVMASSPRVAHAQLTLYDDVGAFVSQTGASAEPAWPDVGRLPGDAGAHFHQGNITITAVSPSSGLWVGSGNHPLVGMDWTTLVPGNDIAIDGQENLDVTFDVAMRAAGFFFAEPTVATVLYAPCSPACPCANSTFGVTLLRSGAVVGAFEYSRADDVQAFVGVVSDRPFDLMRIRELGGSCDDEYFGGFLTLPCAGLCCPVDFNHDGNIDPDDLGDFINCYFAMPPCEGADYNADTNVDPDDLGDYINAYFGLAC